VRFYSSTHLPKCRSNVVTPIGCTLIVYTKQMYNSTAQPIRCTSIMYINHISQDQHLKYGGVISSDSRHFLLITHRFLAVAHIAYGRVLWLLNGVCDRDVRRLGVGMRHLLVVDFGFVTGLCDVVWVVLGDGYVVLFHFGFGYVVGFLHGLVDLLGHGHVVWNLSSVGTVVGLSESLHVVVGSWHMVLLLVHLDLVDFGSVVGNLSLIDDLVRKRLGDEFVLDYGGWVEQGFCHVLVQSVCNQLIVGVPVGVMFHGSLGDGSVENLIVAFLRTAVDWLGGRAIGGLGGSVAIGGGRSVGGFGGCPVGRCRSRVVGFRGRFWFGFCLSLCFWICLRPYRAHEQQYYQEIHVCGVVGLD